MLGFFNRKDFEAYQQDVFEIGNRKTENVIEHSFSPRFAKYTTGAKRLETYTTETGEEIEFFRFAKRNDGCGEHEGYFAVDDPEQYRTQYAEYQAENAEEIVEEEKAIEEQEAAYKAYEEAEFEEFMKSVYE
jgi:aminoglycoside N3'-acetyltransferase